MVVHSRLRRSVSEILFAAMNQQAVVERAHIGRVLARMVRVLCEKESGIKTEDLLCECMHENVYLPMWYIGIG